jgi:4-hydroxy-L-threonine phosphate dehydrogenase PdxA
MSPDIRKPIIGITCGDLNGIGIEIIIKSLSDSRILEFMVPVVFASNKSLHFYRKGLPEFSLNFTSITDLNSQMN